MPYDTVPVAAASYPDLETAERCTTAVVQAHAEHLRAFFADSTPGVHRRLAPIRLDLEEPVGMVVDRDGGVHEDATIATVLLLDVGGGGVQVLSSHPELMLSAPPDLPGLAVLFGAYFESDWRDEDLDPLAVVRRFCEQEPAAREAAVQEWPRLHPQDVAALGSYFVPRPPGQLEAFLIEAGAVLRGS